MCASQDNPSLPWKLVVGGPVVGANERFRLTKDGMLYSGAMGGFFQCSSSNVEMVKGYPFSYSSYSNKVTFQPVSTEMALRARELVDLSTQVNAIQTSYLTAHKTAFAKEQTELENLKEANMSKGEFSTPRIKEAFVDRFMRFLAGISTIAPIVRMAMAIPMTSKGTVMNSISDSPFWSNLFDSFMKSIDWRSNKIIFRSTTFLNEMQSCVL
jgi:hypothetical protein